MLRTIMSGDSVRPMTSARLESAVVPTSKLASSTVRTKRAGLGAPRSNSHSAANAAVATSNGTLFRLTEKRPSHSEMQALSAT